MRFPIRFGQKFNPHFRRPNPGRIQGAGRRSVIPWFYVPLALAAVFAVMLGLVFLYQGIIPGQFGR